MGTSATPELASCSFRVLSVGPRFRRGDANSDGRVDLSDSIAILGCKFLGERCPACRDAADANDDGEVDVSDPIYLLGFQFLGSAPPPSPGPYGCGADLDEDGLPECDYRSCGDPDLPDGPPPPAGGCG